MSLRFVPWRGKTLETLAGQANYFISLMIFCIRRPHQSNIALRGAVLKAYKIYKTLLNALSIRAETWNNLITSAND